MFKKEPDVLPDMKKHEFQSLKVGDKIVLSIKPQFEIYAKVVEVFKAKKEHEASEIYTVEWTSQIKCVLYGTSDIIGPAIVNRNIINDVRKNIIKLTLLIQQARRWAQQNVSKPFYSPFVSAGAKVYNIKPEKKL